MHWNQWAKFISIIIGMGSSITPGTQHKFQIVSLVRGTRNIYIYIYKILMKAVWLTKWFSLLWEIRFRPVCSFLWICLSGSTYSKCVFQFISPSYSSGGIKHKFAKEVFQINCHATSLCSVDMVKLFCHLQAANKKEKLCLRLCL